LRSQCIWFVLAHSPQGEHTTGRMKSSDAKREFEGIMRREDITLHKLRAAYGFRLMLEFYQQVRADGCAFEMDGDMLLFQWGTYDWGQGRHFELDLTRQFLESSDEGDSINQLHLKFHYSPNSEFEALQSGNRWCHDLSKLPEFESFILSSPAYNAVMQTDPQSATISYDQT
jgi:hypothetical protein